VTGTALNASQTAAPVRALRGGEKAFRARDLYNRVSVGTRVIVQ
jgi:hypothetical protein